MIKINDPLLAPKPRLRVDSNGASYSSKPYSSYAYGFTCLTGLVF